jgi:hypothetical protein
MKEEEENEKDLGKFAFDEPLAELEYYKQRESTPVTLFIHH